MSATQASMQPIGGSEMGEETVLRDVSMCDGRHAPGCGQCRLCEAHTAAVAAFAELNGWRRKPGPSSNLDELGHGGGMRPYTRSHSRDRRLLDHPLWFMEARRYVAAVGQPYEEAVLDIEAARAQLSERCLFLHVPPDPLASTHYPGRTLFLVVTRPGVTVRWLPEQDGRLAKMWKRKAA